MAQRDDEKLKKWNQALEGKSPEEILAWCVAEFGQRITLLASMQKTSGMLMHLMSRIAPQTQVIFVDTGVHFPETLTLRDEFMSRFGTRIVTVEPELSFEEQREKFGRYLHESDSAPDHPGYRECCELRKEEPYIRAVRGNFDMVLGGLTRSEGGARSDIPVVGWDDRTETYRVYPLVTLTETDVEAYHEANGVPVHALYAKNYASIGCHTCTTPIFPGEDKRAGRWRHIRELTGNSGPLYCGINLEDIKKRKSS